MVKLLSGAARVRALPFVVAAVAGRLALPLAAHAADISLSRSSVYDGRQAIVLDSAWFGDSVGTALRVEVRDSADAVTYLQPAAGTTEWTPPGNGSYELLMRTFAGETPTGSDLKATFFVSGKAAVTKVSAAQRYPWNGLVDLAFTITGDAETAYQVSFTAKDVAGGTNLVMKTVTVGRSVPERRNLDTTGETLDNDCGGVGHTALPPGSYCAVWNAGADLPDGFESDRVTITVEAR